MSSAAGRARGAILAYFVVLATAFAVLVPPFEAPDEPAHLAYIDFVAARAELPNQYDPQRTLAGPGPTNTEGHQPPLYYALAALLRRLVSPSACVDAPPAPNPLHAWNGAGGTRTDVPRFLPYTGGEAFRHAGDRPCFLVLRLFSVVLGALNVAAVLQLARHFFADRWQLLPAVLTATLPQFLFLSGVINNDALANLLLTLCLLYAAQLLDGPERRGPYLRLGVALGLALLTKKTALFVLPGLALLVGYVAYRHRHLRARIAAGTLAALAATALLSGWFFVRNAALYGDPLASQMEKTTLAALVQEKSLRSPYFVDRFPREFSQSLVGRFGWMLVPLPRLVYLLYALLACVPAVGIVFWVRSQRFPAAKAGFAAVFVLTCFAGIVAYNLTYSQPQGRFLFPVLSLMAIFVTAGLRELLRRLPVRRAGPAVVTCLVGGLVLADAVSLAALVRFYGRPGLLA